MTGLLAMVLAAAAAIVALPLPGGERRLEVLDIGSAGSARQSADGAGDPDRPTPRASAPDRPSEGPPLLLRPPARTGLALAAGLALGLTVGGIRGIALGLATSLALPRVIARLPDPTVAARDRRLVADLPLALDVLAACLSAGAPFIVALQAVSADLPGPLSIVLADVARQLELGASRATAWRRSAAMAPLGALVETVGRVGDSGAALAPALRQLATDERDRVSQAQQAAVRRIGVFVVVPLGTCFLPAFLLLGVVPIVAGLVGGLRI